jgi:hypothetical protein
MTNDEIDALHKGSVLRVDSGKLVVVRGIVRNPKTGMVRSILRARRACSRYPSPLTYLDRHFLRRHCSVTGARVRLDHPMDQALDRELRLSGRHHQMSCEIAKEFPA